MSQTGDKVQRISPENYDVIMQLAGEWTHWEYMKGAWRDSINFPLYHQWASEAKERLIDYLNENSET